MLIATMLLRRPTHSLGMSSFALILHTSSCMKEEEWHQIQVLKGLIRLLWCSSANAYVAMCIQHVCINPAVCLW